MSLNKWISVPFILLYSLSACSQASLDSLLSRVLQNNRTLAGATQYYENTLVSSRTNLYPDNPELEYGYLWSNPGAPGNRTDFSLSQSFEFPGVYARRSKMSKAGVAKASQMVESVRQNTLLEAKQLWIEKVYVNRKMEMLNQSSTPSNEFGCFFSKSILRRNSSAVDSCAPVHRVSSCMKCVC